MPTVRGLNAISGPGVDTPKEFEQADASSVMLQKMHSDEWGRRLAAACEAYLIGADADEEELTSAVLAAGSGADTGSASFALRAILCERVGQPCAVAIRALTHVHGE